VRATSTSHVIAEVEPLQTFNFHGLHSAAHRDNQPITGQLHRQTDHKLHRSYIQPPEFAISPFYDHTDSPDSQLHKHASSSARTQEGTKENTQANLHPQIRIPRPDQNHTSSAESLTFLFLKIVPGQARRSATKRLAQSHGHAARLRRLLEHRPGRGYREPTQQRESAPGHVRDSRKCRRHAGSAGSYRLW